MLNVAEPGFKIKSVHCYTSTVIDFPNRKKDLVIWLFKYRDTCIGGAQKHAKSISIRDAFATC